MEDHCDVGWNRLLKSRCGAAGMYALIGGLILAVIFLGVMFFLYSDIIFGWMKSGLNVIGGLFKGA